MEVSGTNAESGRWGKDTSGGAEAIEFVLVVAGRGGAPAVAIRATVCGAGGVRAALKSERKHAGLAVRIAVLGVESWEGRHITPRVLTHRPPVYSIRPLPISQIRKLGPEHRRVTCRSHSTSDRAGIKTQSSGPSRVVGVPHHRRTPHSLSLGQKPNRRSLSKSAVVLHQSKSSERPSVVQAE